MRFIIVAILVILSFYGQNIINQLRRTEAGSDTKKSSQQLIKSKEVRL
jgi:hypothetical protein